MREESSAPFRCSARNTPLPTVPPPIIPRLTFCIIGRRACREERARTILFSPRPASREFLESKLPFWRRGFRVALMRAMLNLTSRLSLLLGLSCCTTLAQDLALPKLPGAKPRNIIFILTDDQRYDALGFM